jgi:hypothetical protein
MRAISTFRPRRPARGIFAASAALLPTLGVGCADMLGQSAPPATPTGPRTGPDDSDLWNLAPGNADVLAEVDLAALRASPWSRALTESGLSGERQAGRRLFGYDLFDDAERFLAVGSEASGAPRTLTIVRGRFDPARIGEAFAAATPGAVAGRWRESPIWEGDGRAVALVTPRTLVQGEPNAVRAAIDAAWGIVPDGHTSPLGELRRLLDAERTPPAAFIALTVTDGVRARAAGFIDLPPGLINVAGRLDLGDDLNGQVIGTLDSVPDALQAVALGNLAIQNYAQNQMVKLLGFSPILQAVLLTPDGPRVRGHLRVPAENREGLSDKLLAVLQLVAGARH